MATGGGNDMVLPPRNGLSLCSGGGGLDMGLMLAEPEFHTRCFVEWDEYPRQTLIAAQRAGYFAPAPIWDDVTTFDARPIAGAIDTLLAGYPCQPFSAAGQRKGENDERHLWPDIERIIGELGPSLRWCFFENVAGHLSLGLDTVLRSLRDLGFTTAAGLFSAEEVGATHERQRVFIVAYRAGERLSERGRYEQQEAKAQSRSGLVAEPQRHCGSAELADADGGNTCSERKQRSWQQRFHAEGGRAFGKSDLANSGIGRPCEPGKGQDQQPRGAETFGSGADVGDATILGRGEGRTEPSLWSGRRTIACTGGELADASRTEPQGQQRGIYDTEGRQKPNGYSALCGRAGIFPPGPNNRDAWIATLAMAPDLAPAVSLRDVKRACDNAAQMVAQGRMEESEAESIVCGMAHELSHRPRILKLLGNAVVPLQAAYAWRTLSATHGLGWVSFGEE